jgi:hypothetical protein
MIFHNVDKRKDNDMNIRKAIEYAILIGVGITNEEHKGG